MNPTDRDPYIEKPFYRWLALTAALMAWGFDGVEQGVYALMTRAALKDLIPGGASEADIGFYFGLSMAMWLWGAAVGRASGSARWVINMDAVRMLLFAVVTYSIFTGSSRRSRTTGGSSRRIGFSARSASAARGRCAWRWWSRRGRKRTARCSPARSNRPRTWAT